MQRVWLRSIETDENSDMAPKLVKLRRQHLAPLAPAAAKRKLERATPAGKGSRSKEAQKAAEDKARLILEKKRMGKAAWQEWCDAKRKKKAEMRKRMPELQEKREEVPWYPNSLLSPGFAQKANVTPGTQGKGSHIRDKARPSSQQQIDDAYKAWHDQKVLQLRNEKQKRKEFVEQAEAFRSQYLQSLRDHFAESKQESIALSTSSSKMGSKKKKEIRRMLLESPLLPSPGSTSSGKLPRTLQPFLASRPFTAPLPSKITQSPNNESSDQPKDKITMHENVLNSHKKKKQKCKSRRPGTKTADERRTEKKKIERYKKAKEDALRQQRAADDEQAAQQLKLRKLEKKKKQAAAHQEQNKTIDDKGDHQKCHIVTCSTGAERELADVLLLHIGKVCRQKRIRLIDLFNQEMDGDQGDSVNLSELSFFFKNLGVEMKAGLVKDIFVLWDTDSNRVINILELDALIRKVYRSQSSGTVIDTLQGFIAKERRKLGMETQSQSSSKVTGSEETKSCPFKIPPGNENITCDKDIYAMGSEPARIMQTKQRQIHAPDDAKDASNDDDTYSDDE